MGHLSWKSAGSGVEFLAAHVSICRCRARPSASVVHRYRPQTLPSPHVDHGWWCQRGGRSAVAFAKDQWTKAVEQADGTVKRERNEKRWGEGSVGLESGSTKRGREVEGLRHQGQGGPVCQRDGDRHRAWGVHRSAGWESSVRPLSERWLASRIVDPSTLIRYETALRLHVDPVFGCRQLSSVKPSEIASWLADLQCAVRPGDGAYGVRSAARHAGACRGRRHDQAQSGQGSSGVGTAVVVQSWPRLAPADPPHQNAGGRAPDVTPFVRGRPLFNSRSKR